MSENTSPSTISRSKKLLLARASLLGARTLGAPGITTRSKKLLLVARTRQISTCLQTVAQQHILSPWMWTLCFWTTHSPQSGAFIMLEAIASRLEANASMLEAIASRLEAVAFIMFHFTHSAELGTLLASKRGYFRQVQVQLWCLSHNRQTDQVQQPTDLPSDVAA